MDDQADRSPFTDRHARCLIVEAEAHGFEREPELYARHYDHALHEDAQDAAAYLRARDPAALETAESAPDPLPTWVVVDRLVDEGRVTLADVRAIVQEAADRGYVAPEPAEPWERALGEWHQARAPLSFLWESDPAWLLQLLGEEARLAPLPETAIDRVDVVIHKYAGPIPSEPPSDSEAFKF